MSFSRVCVCGLGTIGLPTARYIKSKGFSVFGYDLNAEAVRRSAFSDIQSFDSWQSIPKSDVYIITVNTWWKDVIPDAFPVYDVCKKIAKTNPQSLVSLESTLPIGTSRLISKLGLCNLVHVPHRWWPEKSERYGVNQIRVMGSLNDQSRQLALEFFRALNIPIEDVGDLEAAELVKLLENSWRNIAVTFTEQAALLCKSLEVNYDTVRKGANSRQGDREGTFLYLLEPRDGVGGTCLPKDIRFLIYEATQRGVPADLLTGAVKLDQKYKLSRVGELVADPTEKKAVPS